MVCTAQTASHSWHCLSKVFLTPSDAVHHSSARGQCTEREQGQTSARATLAVALLTLLGQLVLYMPASVAL